jgi:hypothetical protein
MNVGENSGARLVAAVSGPDPAGHRLSEALRERDTRDRVEVALT